MIEEKQTGRKLKRFIWIGICIYFLIPKTIKDYYKIHMDTGAWSNGVLGCVCIDTLKVYYVKK